MSAMSIEKKHFIQYVQKYGCVYDCVYMEEKESGEHGCK